MKFCSRISEWLLLLAILIAIEGCSKLDEKFQGDLNYNSVSSDTSMVSLISGMYNSMEYPFTSHLVIFPLSELTTDLALLPMRGQDWTDNGEWAVLHQHKWNPANSHTRECFNALSGISYAATDVLQFHPNQQQQSEARFIRAWAMYLLLDMFDQVPYRDPGESLVIPSRVRRGEEALNYIVSELETIKPSLPPGPANIANRFAASVLLMKCYLNKPVYKNRLNPEFNDVNDLNKVISLADEIIASGRFQLSTNYFDNFSPENTIIGKENIFTLQNEPGVTPNNNLILSFVGTFHYDMLPFGANGWAVLSEFYKKFESTDIRRGTNYIYPNCPPNPGNRISVGLLGGQQYNLFSDELLVDHGDNTLLILEPEVKNVETGKNLRRAGYRGLKYPVDWVTFFSPDNDFVFFRLPDVLLMKAEAILRGGTASGDDPLAIVNSIRTDPSRNASALSSMDLNSLLDERARELWFEGWRRQDLIRFKKFLIPFQEKNYEDDPMYLVFPIPNDQLAVNKNLKQNPGY